ncbi:hypothetical protein OF83DRAFT_1170088 [Amylostereum chailletii]|nr:hypothetical protein OF83DRAFT_1170088 [Amylostereum chailletii]
MPTPSSPPNANACVAPNANTLDANPHRPHHLHPHHLNVNAHVAPNANARVALDVNALVTCQRPRLPPMPTYPMPSSPLNANTLDADAHVSPHCQRASPPASTPSILMPMSPANAHALVSPQRQCPQRQCPRCQRPCLLPMPTRFVRDTDALDADALVSPQRRRRRFRRLRHLPTPTPSSPAVDANALVSPGANVPVTRNADALDADAYITRQCPCPCLPPTPMPLSPPVRNAVYETDEPPKSRR